MPLLVDDRLSQKAARMKSKVVAGVALAAITTAFLSALVPQSAGADLFNCGRGLPT
jgi:hypothetical protein